MKECKIEIYVKILWFNKQNLDQIVTLGYSTSVILFPGINNGKGLFI